MGDQPQSYSLLLCYMPMYNTMTILCVWDKSGPVRITIVVAQILIFNDYLFVMDIK